jgi:hypothetical protein
MVKKKTVRKSINKGPVRGQKIPTRCSRDKQLSSAGAQEISRGVNSGKTS